MNKGEKELSCDKNVIILSLFLCSEVNISLKTIRYTNLNSQLVEIIYKTIVFRTVEPFCRFNNLEVRLKFSPSVINVQEQKV